MRRKLRRLISSTTRGRASTLEARTYDLAVKNALILHGTSNSPNGNWFPWLANELGWRGYEVSVPQLPNADKPELDEYWQHLQSFPFNEETVIVGHSSGATMALAILHKLPANVRVKSAFCVAPFYRDAGFNCEGLFTEEYDWEKIRNQTDQIEILWSHDDPYIDEEQISFICSKLEIQPRLFYSSGHFNLEAGERFREFPALRDLVVN